MPNRILNVGDVDLYVRGTLCPLVAHRFKEGESK